MADTSIRVIARFRPISEREKREFVEGKEGMQLDFRDEQTVQLAQGSGKEPILWTFDRVFHGSCSQSDIFELAAKETAEDVLRGYNGTIFAYGQTGSGKSHTMMGPDILDDSMAGIIPRACRFIFDHVAKNPDYCEFKVTCSFLEIYKEVIKDLLNPKGVNLKVRETPTRGVWVEGLSETEVSSHMEVLRLLHQGEEHRAVASTNMNAVSSRSHSLFILTVTQKTRDGATKIGKLNLADLAGSEKVGKTGASGETLEEAKKINQSLSALGNCIMALTKKNKAHVPYRDSKLTFILRESLGGNTKTTLLIACSPHIYNLDETISTLRFGQRAKAIKNKVKINAQRSVAELELIVKKLTKEVKVLKKYSTRLEQELSKLQIEGLDLEAIKRQLFEEAAAGSQKLPEPTTPSQLRNRKSGDVESDGDEELRSDGATPRKELDESGDSRLDGSQSLPASPKRTRNGFSLATQADMDSPSLVRSSSMAKGLRGTPSRPRLDLDLDLTASPMSMGNTTPTRPTIFLDGILNDDETEAMLDAQLEYNRMKEHLNLQIQDLTEDIAQVTEEKESIIQQHRMQLAKAAEENVILQREIESLKSQLSQLQQQTSPRASQVSSAAAIGTDGTESSSSTSPLQNTPASPAVPPTTGVPSKSTSPVVVPSNRRSSVSNSPRGPIVIPLDGSSPLRREAGDPVFMTRQMFHWMVLATKLEMFSQGNPMRYDADFDSIFRELIDSSVSTQTWPKKIMKALEVPSAPPPSPAGKAPSSPSLRVPNSGLEPMSPSSKSLAAQSAPYLHSNHSNDGQPSNITQNLRDIRG